MSTFWPPWSAVCPRSSSFRGAKARPPARPDAPRIGLVSLVALAAFAAGCYHLVEPVEPATIVRGEDESVTSFAPGTRIVLENLREEAGIVRVRREGLHVLEVDLRDWSLRLLDALAVELERLGAEVRFARAAGAGDSSPDPRLRLELERIDFPRRDGSGEAFLAGRVASEPEGYERALASRGAESFTEAYRQLVRAIADDPALREWLARRGR